VRPNAKYWALYVHGTHVDCPTDPDLARSSRRRKKCFQTDFKSEFSGVLDRTFSYGFLRRCENKFQIRQPYLSAIDAVKHFEVNYIRPVDGSSGEDTNCIQYGSPKMFNCWVIEFSIKIDTKSKLVNGMSFDQAMAEGKYFQLLLQLCKIFNLFLLLDFLIVLAMLA